MEPSIVHMPKVMFLAHDTMCDDSWDLQMIALLVVHMEKVMLFLVAIMCDDLWVILRMEQISLDPMR